MKARLWLWRGAALLALLLAYANAWQNGFHFDDFHTVVDNPSIRSLHNIPQFFRDASTFSVLPANRTYRPIVSASLSLDYALGHGYRPVWFHLSTLVTYLVLIWLLCVVYRRAMIAADIDKDASLSVSTELLALGAAMWFGLHPAMAETVNYVIQRGDLYVTTGCVAALAVWIAWPKGRWTGVYLLPLVLALFSKPPAAVFPLLLMLWIYFFESEGSASRRWLRSLRQSLPALAVTAGLMMLQSRMTPKSFVGSVDSAYAYRITQPYVWLRYCTTLFFPFHLNVDTDLRAYDHLAAPVLLGFLFLALLIAVIAACCRHRRLYPIAYGLLWFLITQLPTSLYPLSEVENDHRIFFSFVGLILAVVWALRLGYGWLRERALSPSLLRVPVVASVLLLACYAWGTHTRNAVWKSEESLWLDDVQKCPHNGRGHMNYGLALMARGDAQGADREFTEALQYTPNYPSLFINLGVVNGLLGRQAVAEQAFQHALTLAPADDSTHAFYGRWLIEQGRFEEAAAQERQAIALNPARTFQRDLLAQALGPHAAPQNANLPQDAGFWMNASLNLYRAGRYVESEAAARRALVLRPGLASAHNNIGAAEASLGHWDAAVAEEQQALRLDPKLQIAANNLQAYRNHSLTLGTQPTAGQPASVDAWINRSLQLNREGRFEESIAAARAALRMNPSSAEAWNNIAAGDEALHRWDDAIDASRRALAIKPDLQIAKNNLAWSLQQKQEAAAGRGDTTPR
ncbi:tetratricopeptide repeat protein [Silvibacterium sp.]|uniref:tetratricopeptide repeat protein n=1 Tax=Silvibacterium sp. TaxID=1964179 RepID=UPI0039E3E3F4